MTTFPSSMTGSSTSERNVAPAFVLSTSMPSVRRTLSIVLAGTVTGAGARAGAGAAGGGAGVRDANSMAAMSATVSWPAMGESAGTRA